MILLGDCRDVLKTLPDASVDCCVTSPPYFALRDYGMDGQIGLEPAPEAFVAELVAVFQSVWRVLKNDGTLWLNLGDSYAGSGKGGNPDDSPWKGFVGNTAREAACTKTAGEKRIYAGTKAKDLIGIPWMVAFALRADGWYLRSDIIWSKPNPMPESVQGTHFSRHRVTIDEYERLSGLRYVDERAGDAWAGDMPALSERESVSRKAPLSAEREGDQDISSARATRGCAREASDLRTITIRPSEQGQVRNDREGQTDAAQSIPEISSQHTREKRERDTASTDEGTSAAQGATPCSEQRVPKDGEGEGAIEAPTRSAQRGDSLHGGPVDGGGLGRDYEGASVALPLLSQAAETDDRPCDPSQQGRPAHQDEHRPGVRSVQFQEAGQTDRSVLVGCPGCPKCIQHHGYTFHLSAGRPTKAHEYLFLLSKSRSYYYDADAISEPVSASMIEQLKQGYSGSATKDYAAAGAQDPSAVKSRILSKSGNKERKFRSEGEYGGVEGSHSNQGFAVPWEEHTRNKRSVWTITPQPYAEAHFAVMPEDLVEPCIRAGSREGGTVLDPFAGAGTVGVVCEKLRRKFLGIELNPAYVEIAERRIANVAPLFHLDTSETPNADLFTDDKRGTAVGG